MRSSRRHERWKRVGGVLLFCIGCLVSGLFAALLSPPHDQEVTSVFQERLRQYVAWQSEGFLTWLVAKEKQLVQLIRLVSQETEARLKEGQPPQTLVFPTVYGPADSLAAAYAREIQQLLLIYDDLSALERSLSGEDLQLWEEVVRTRDEVIAALEDRKIYSEVGYTPTDLGALVKDFSREVDSLLALYDRLARLERTPAVVGNPQALQQIAQQKEHIATAIAQVRPPSPVAQRVVQAYLSEADSLVRVLRMLDTIVVPEGDSAAIVRETLLRTKWELLDRVDQRMVRLAGYQGPLPASGLTVSEFLAEWERERTADLEARFAAYLVAKRALIETATDKQRDRMLAREVKDALANYAQGDYVLAELQLAAVLEHYGQYYRGLDPVIFYRSECFFAQGYLDAALSGYQEIVDTQPASAYFTESLLRLMQISAVYGRKADFYRYFDKMQEAAERAHPQELNKGYMMAGLAQFRDGRFDEALATLAKVSPSSPHWMDARLLTGVIYAAQNNYAEAVPVFTSLADQATLPWTDQRAVEIRNAALLRLGLIAYQRGEYSRAEEYFARISSGYTELDKSVIAAAWAAFKQGNYELALTTCQRLVADFPASPYSYEALVLAAHCNRILGKKDQALAAHRYVADARGAVEVAGQYQTELQRLIAQVQALNRLEREALDRRDLLTYPEIVRLRKAIQQTLDTVRYRSNLGVRLLADLRDETQGLLDQIEALGVLIAEAQAAGREDLAAEAEGRRFRLLEILADLHARPATLNSSYLLDFPAVAREMEMRYRAQSIATVVQELEAERNRVAANLEGLRTLQNGDKPLPFSAQFELELIERRLRSLQNDLSRFRAWVASQPVEQIGSQLQEWADRAGFEMSDIAYSSLQEEEQAVESYAERLAAVNALLEARRQALNAHLVELDRQVAQLQAEAEAKRVAQEREQRAHYFKTAYFDTTEREESVSRVGSRPRQPY